MDEEIIYSLIGLVIGILILRGVGAWMLRINEVKTGNTFFIKRIELLLIATLGLVLLSCAKNTPKNIDFVCEQNQSQTHSETQTEIIPSDNIDDKYLITNNSVGYFKIGGSWQNFAKNDYKYKYVQGYGTCTDACCDGGFDLGGVISNDNYGLKIESPEITIGCLPLNESDSIYGHNSNPSVFYISSDNCNGWYWKDKISYFVIYSEAFKTKEGIGVGTTLEKIQEIFGKVVIFIGWLEEDANAIQIEVNSYPNLALILDVDDAIGGYEKLSSHENQYLSITNFRKNTKIKRLIIHMTTN